MIETNRPPSWLAVATTAACLAATLPAQQPAQQPPQSDPAAQQLVAENLADVFRVLAPPGTPALPIAVTLRCIDAGGGASELEGRTLRLVYQHPDRLRLEADLDGTRAIIGANGPALWIHVPEKRLVLLGSPEVPRFAADPASAVPAGARLLELPVQPEQLPLLPAVAVMNLAPDESGHDLLRIKLMPEAVTALKAPAGELSLRLGGAGRTPDRLGYRDGNFQVRFEVVDFASGAKVPPDEFTPRPNEGDTVEKVSSAHLARFLKVLPAALDSGAAPLPPATGARRLVAESGRGRLEDHDGTRVLFLAGTPEEIGAQHGTLLKDAIRQVVDRILYGVGVGSSIDKGRWFFGEIEDARRRVEPFIDPRHLREMDAIAHAAGLHPQEVRLANIFPELFHCSGFALLGTATADARIYHGRILDYLKGVGLEQNAVVMVVRPDHGHAWVNCGYAGFTGSVTAMNEQQLAIGEMGGRGEGRWDGKPMAQLVREVMERAATIDEALDIMRKGPRTCEYYYVLSDAKARRACGIKATPDTFEVVWQGEPHPQLPEAVADTVILSAGDRYAELVRRIRAGHGSFTADSARALMTKPVCMGSNIQSVLFCPDSLDFWVANADRTQVASHARYTQYNLRKLLESSQP